MTTDQTPDDYVLGGHLAFEVKHMARRGNEYLRDQTFTMVVIARSARAAAAMADEYVSQIQPNGRNPVWREVYSVKMISNLVLSDA